MTRPVVSEFTERVYAALPTVYGDSDAVLDYPLLRWLSLLCDQGGEVLALHERIDYVTTADGGTGALSELVDPQAADEAWLPWLAQLVGVTDLTGLSGVAARDAITAAAAGFQSGTKAAVAAAARSALTGSRYVKVYDHSVSRPGDGGVWDVLLVTRTAETPDVSAVLAAVVAKKAKPAGVHLHHMAYSATFSETRAALGTDTLAARQARFSTFQDASDYLP